MIVGTMKIASWIMGQNILPHPHETTRGSTQILHTIANEGSWIKCICMQRFETMRVISDQISAEDVVRNHHCGLGVSGDMMSHLKRYF